MAELTEYERGMMEALRIMKEQSDAMNAPLRNLEVGAAHVAINAVTHWGQTLVGNTESAVLRHLYESRRKGAKS